MAILFSLSIAMFAGLMLSRLAKLVNLPAVTAYLVAGVLIGPFCLGAFGVEGLGFTSKDNLESFSIISDVALGFIAFSIGNEFRLSQLKTIGKQATVIGIIQAVVTTILVDIALVLLHFILGDKFPLPSVIILGAIASATAPAATLMVVRQYKAKGPLTDTLLPVVALDDAVGLVLFAISFGIAKSLIMETTNVLAIILEPLIEIVASLGVGALMGYVFSFFERFFHSRSKRLSMTVAFVLVTVAVSMIHFEIGGIKVGFSPLLSCMMLGTIFCNVCDFSEELMDRLERWTAPIYILFFVISGAELDLSVLANGIIVLIGVVYIVFRCFGKYLGAYSSAKLVKAPDTVRKYLGITLFPQAGVALGMTNIVTTFAKEMANTAHAQMINEVAIIVQSITLFSVLIYELVGPYLTKVSLVKAGEVDPEGKTSARGNVERKA